MVMNVDKFFGKGLAVILCISLTLCINYNITHAATGKISSNIHDQNYMFSGAVNGHYANPVCSYLVEDSEGNINRIEAVDNSIVVETYHRENFSLIATSNIIQELPIFGGFYAGENYNYVVFGQNNPDEDDSQEVLRIVQYDKKWNRVASDSMYGGNTIIPFSGGSLRMCESGNMLYIRTCHEMYKTADGRNHQTNMTLSFNSKIGKITDKSTTVVSNLSTGYVSHSFNQFIKSDKTDIVAADHGDGYPRSFVLFKYAGKAGNEFLGQTDGWVELLSFPGNNGENYTGASLGGLEVSSTNYLITYNSVEQELFYGCVRNIYVAAVNKDNFLQSAVHTKQLTQFGATGKQSASNPLLVKLSSDEFLLLWEIYDADKVDTLGGNPGTDTIQYVKLDGSGNAIGEIHTEKGKLSDCQPIVSGQKVIWYVTDNSAPEFYTIDIQTENVSVVSTGQELKPEETQKPEVEKTPIPSPTQTIMPEINSNVNTTVLTDTDKTLKKPSRVTKLKVKPYKKSMKVLWKCQLSINGGYQIRYATNKKFTRNNKTKNVNQWSSENIIKGLKKNTYYVKVRAYNKEGLKRAYGSWSVVKKVKIKG